MTEWKATAAHGEQGMRMYALKMMTNITNMLNHCAMRPVLGSDSVRYNRLRKVRAHGTAWNHQCDNGEDSGFSLAVSYDAKPPSNLCRDCTTAL